MNEKLIDEENENIIENNSIQIEEEEEKKELKDIEEENKVDNNLDEFPESNKNLEKLITNKNRKINPKILFYYKLFISVFLFVNSVISFSFLNILHLLYSYFIIYNMYSSIYSFKIKLENYIAFGIIICDVIFLVFKGTIHLYISSTDEYF